MLLIADERFCLTIRLAAALVVILIHYPSFSERNINDQIVLFICCFLTRYNLNKIYKIIIN